MKVELKNTCLATGCIRCRIKKVYMHVMALFRLISSLFQPMLPFLFYC